jgi:hypothetical protein
MGLAAASLALVLPGAAQARDPLFGGYQYFPTGIQTASTVAVGDLNGDGRTDVVVGRMAPPAVFYRQTDGTFGGEVDLPVPNPPGGPYDGVGIGDFDRDGKADLAVAADDYVWIFLQKHGQLVRSAPLELPGRNRALTVHDMNRDGRPDILVSDWDDGTYLFTNTRSGFVLRKIAPTPLAHLVVADVNRDGRLDVVGGDCGPGGLCVDLQGSGGNFGEFAIPTGEPMAGGDVAVGDVTGDGRPDLVTVEDWNVPWSAVLVLPQTGAGSFGRPVRYPSTDTPGAVAIADLNGDGRQDVVVAHDSWGDAGVYLGRPDHKLDPERLFPLGTTSFYDPGSLLVTNLVGDGRPDLVLAGQGEHNGLLVLPQVASKPAAPPVVTITSGPPSQTPDREAQLTFTSNDPKATFQCAPDVSFGSGSPASRRWAGRRRSRAATGSGCGRSTPPGSARARATPGT